MWTSGFLMSGMHSPPPLRTIRTQPSRGLTDIGETFPIPPLHSVRLRWIAPEMLLWPAPLAPLSMQMVHPLNSRQVMVCPSAPTILSIRTHVDHLSLPCHNPLFLVQFSRVSVVMWVQMPIDISPRNVNVQFFEYIFVCMSALIILACPLFTAIAELAQTSRKFMTTPIATNFTYRSIQLLHTYEPLGQLQLIAEAQMVNFAWRSIMASCALTMRGVHPELVVSPHQLMYYHYHAWHL